MAGSILVAEDEDALRKVLSHGLKKMGYPVIAVADGQQAWEVLQESESEIELIISDWMMPNMTGLALLERKRSDERFADIPFLMLTARTSESDLAEAFGDGVHDYLTKPYKLQELLARSTRLISEHQSKKQLKEKISRDALTGLYNRGRFDEDFIREQSCCHKHGAKLALIMIDIDKFKEVNDTHGHLTGDCVLKEATARIAALCEDNTLYRLGGEEFIVILRDSDEAAAALRAEELRAAVANGPYDCEGTQLPITISCGVAQYATTEASAEFLERLDKALYRAKETGRNRVVCATN